MRVIVQNLNTHLFPKPRGGWTAKAREAKDFGMDIHAREVGRQLRMKRFHVLLFFPELNQYVVAGAMAWGRYRTAARKKCRG